MKIQPTEQVQITTGCGKSEEFSIIEIIKIPYYITPQNICQLMEYL
jgi:hypothetical protein